MVQDTKTRLCETNPEWRTGDDYDYPANFQDLLSAEMNLEFDDSFGSELVWDLCQDNKIQWEYGVQRHMGAEGNNKLMQIHFGLDVFIMPENMDESTVSYIKTCDERVSYHDHLSIHQATICYLVLPSQAAQCEVQIDFLGRVLGESAKPMLIDRNLLNLTEEHQKSFARAMRRLALKPEVHASQLRNAMSAVVLVRTPSSSKQFSAPLESVQVSDDEFAKRHAATKKRIQDLEQSQWPKLMLLVNHHNY